MTSAYSAVPSEVTHPRADMDALAEATIGALRAPSILNTQPWRWRFGRDDVELWADSARQLPGIDPDGRMLRLSCGAALDHAVTVLRATRHNADVRRLPNPAVPALIARIGCGGHRRPEPDEAARYGAIYARRTDRRPFADLRPSTQDIAEVQAAARRHDAYLHILSPSGILTLAAAADRAGRMEHADEVRHRDLADWTNRPSGTDDGISPRSVVAGGDRTVVPRDFDLDAARLDPGTGKDRGTIYAVLFTNGDDPIDWLHAGEALSDLWLTLTARGLAASPISEVVEVPSAREQLRQELAGVGHPAIALRIGVPARTDPPPPTPRRDASEVITLPGR